MQAHAMRWMAAVGVGALALGLAAPVHALDAWRDRRGAFAGVALGGGGASPSSTDSRLAKDRDGVGLFFLGRAGGGLSEKLTVDLSLSWFGSGKETRTRTETNEHMLMAVAANAFLTEHAFARLGAGIGRDRLADDISGAGEAASSAFTLGFLVGGGVEFFLNSDLAASFTLQWQQHLFSDQVRMSGVFGYAGLTWY